MAQKLNKVKVTPIFTPNFRVDFPHVFEMGEWRNTNTGEVTRRYQVQMVFKKTADLSKMNKMLKDCVTEAWRGLKKPKHIVLPFKSGPEDLDLQKYPQYKNKIVAKAATQRPIGIIDIKREIIPKERSSEIYSGCWCRAYINCFAYEFGNNCGVSFGLLALQKVKEGKPWDGSVNAVDAFKAAPELPQKYYREYEEREEEGMSDYI